ncbi:hypothetical protein TMM008_00070 [Pseudomonas sp. 008]|nr:hypothetical protein TMM008_00070 [Pseudomonas sp. 008]
MDRIRCWHLQCRFYRRGSVLTVLKATIGVERMPLHPMLFDIVWRGQIVNRLYQTPLDCHHGHSNHPYGEDQAQ